MTPPKNPQPVLRTRAAFTPTRRTPWGGSRIAARYGAELGLDAGTLVGEAWVFSLDPAFPSTVDGEALGDRVESTLLVKLLDAAEPLSVQIHPADDYPGLRAEESGKPEAWYVVERDPGAGLFLGFRPGVDEARVRRALDEGEDLSALMLFVPVEPGDFFVIDAGTPHAIGPGVMLVEPQRVLAGWSGVTYRYWDWNRRYDAAGQPSAHGKSRELHVAHALAVTNWERVTQEGFVDMIRARAGAAPAHGPGRLEPLTLPAHHAESAQDADEARLADEARQADQPEARGGDEPARSGLSGSVASVPSGDLRVARLVGTGPCATPDWTDWGVAALVVLEGALETSDGQQVARGETVALSADGSVLELRGAHALLMTARPPGTSR